MKQNDLPAKAVFLDRDGIVNFRPVGTYVRFPLEFSFIPDFFDFFRTIKKAGYMVILITNQQGVGKGLMNLEELSAVHEYMQMKTEARTGYKFDDIYFSPDLADSGSPRRKPEPGMILEAAEKWNIDISGSWMVGDGKNDAKAGKSAGCRTILIGNYFQDECPEADYIANNLDMAAEIILQRNNT